MMRDVPGLILIFALFTPLALILLIYSRSGASPLPEVQGSWAIVEQIEQQIRSRELQLGEGEKRQNEVAPFSITTQRLVGAAAGTSGQSRYLVTVVPTEA